MSKSESDSPAGAVAASNTLQQESDQPTSFDAEAFAEALKTNSALRSAFDEAVARRLQSEKDRRINQVERRQDEFDERLAAYEKYRAEGMSPEKAKQAIEMDDALEYYRQQRKSQAVPQPEQAGNQEVVASGEAMEFLKQAGISEDDPEVMQVLRNTPAAKVTGEIAKLVVRRVTNTPKPGQVIQPSGGSVPAADMMSEYQAKASKLQPGSQAMLQLRAEYRKKGLAI